MVQYEKYDICEHVRGYMKAEASIRGKKILYFSSPSQNHRMVGAGRDLCGSSSPTTLPKQGHLQQAAEDLVQADLEYLQRRRMHNLSGQPVPVLLQCQNEEFLPHFQLKFPMLHFVPITPCAVAGHH